MSYVAFFKPVAAAGQLDLLLHFNGSNGSSTFTDSSPSPKTIGNDGTGTAALSTAQFKYGTASVLVSAGGGNDHWLTALALRPNLRTFAMGGWFRMPSGGSSVVMRISTGSDSFAVQVDADTLTTYIGDTDTGVTHVSGYGAAPNTWVHWFVSRDATGVIRGALGGTMGGTTRTHVGALGMSGADTTELCFCTDIDAYFDDMFVVFNDPIHTASFTPPASEFAYP